MVGANGRDDPVRPAAIFGPQAAQLPVDSNGVRTNGTAGIGLRTERLQSEAIPSSSPAFATAPHPIRPHRQNHTGSQGQAPGRATVLPIRLDPVTLRPLAFRVLTKAHSLTLHSSALQTLATFIAAQCGSAWREGGLAERVLDEVGKAWKGSGGGIILTAEGQEGELLKSILKGVEASMSGGKVVLPVRLQRQNSLVARPGRLDRGDSQQSFGLSALDVEGRQEDAGDEGEDDDPRSWLKVVDAFDHPRYTYVTSKKAFERIATRGTLLPPASQKTQLFRQRYALIHQRLLRNPSFQQSTILSTSKVPALARTDTMSTTQSRTYKLTQISALLGRSGTAHNLLGYLSITPTGSLSISDPSGAVILDIMHCREGTLKAIYTAGMIVVVQGVYEEAGLEGFEGGGGSDTLGADSGVGGMIGGRFLANEMSQPSTERRAVSLGIQADLQRGEGDENGVAASTDLAAGGFGYFDFTGLGSHRLQGDRMNATSRRILSSASPLRNRIVILGECNLDDSLTLSAIRKILTAYATSPDSQSEEALIPIIPIAFILTGNFTRYPVLAAEGGASGTGAGSGGSIEYKEAFDTLSAMLADYPLLLAHSTFMFVPGDNDAWDSSHSAGASTVLPRKGIPDLFTSRLKRTFTSANSEVHRTDGATNRRKRGAPCWLSNPCRVGLFGPSQELVIFRDDVSPRLRRHGLRMNMADLNEENPDAAMADDDPSSTLTPTDEHPPLSEQHLTHPLESSHRLLLTSLLSQSTLSPFPPTIRPVLWDRISSLSLYPLPSILVLVDPHCQPFVDRFDGCLCINPGPVLGKGGKRWAVVGEITMGLSPEGMRTSVEPRARIRRLRF